MTTAQQDSDAVRLEKAYRLIQRQKERIAALERDLSAPIAIIGRACRVPGAETLEAFHALLCDGADAIGRVPPGRWAEASDIAQVGGFVDPVDRLDPGFFQMTPREAARLDPQHALVLENGWSAIEDAGIDPLSLSGSRTGVFLGISEGDYRYVSRAEAGGDIQSLTGGASSVACSRLSYLLDLHGPSLPVDTACSASLVAIHLAICSLRQGECDMALAGGVNALLSPETTDYFVKAGALAANGRCKTFDAAADGYVRSEGCGMVLLKPFDAAIRDGDRIVAVILGSAINQDGRTNGLMSPNGAAQDAVIRAALQNAGKKPFEIGYVEAHGTGTALGDPIELGALGAVFKDRGAKLPVGSIKSNIGHLEGAAGVVGLLKAVRIVETGLIPKSLHFAQPNPYADWETMPLRVAHQQEELPLAQRTVGVSSFGFSGTNAHIVLAAPPDEAMQEETANADASLHLLKLSARTPSALTSMAQRHGQHISQMMPDRLDAYCRTAALGRSDFPERACILADTPASMAEQLRGFVDGRPSLSTFSGLATKGTVRTAFLATGQGAEQPRMGRELYETAPIFRDAILECERILLKDRVLSEPLHDLLFSGDGTRLRQTANVQPALFALSYALSRFWASIGIEPDVLIGHSTGEYAAACIAGCFSLEDGLAMIARRARLIEDATRGGATAVVFAAPGDVSGLLAELDGSVTVTAQNSPQETLIAGPEQAVLRALSRVEEKGWRARRLAIPYAPHSPMIDPVIEQYRAQIAGVSFHAPHTPLLSNVTGDVLERLDADYLCRQLREPVRFSAAITRLQAFDCSVMLEIGPEPVLQLLARQNWTSAPPLWASSLWSARSDRRQVLETIAELYTHGVDIDWRAVTDVFSHARKRISVPTYPFDAEDMKEEVQPRSHGSEPQDLAGALVMILADLTESQPDELDPRASFVELGADSLLLGRLALTLAERFEVDVSIGQLFDELRTVELLAAHVRAHTGSGLVPAPVRVKRRDEAVTVPLEAPARKIHVPAGDLRATTGARSGTLGQKPAQAQSRDLAALQQQFIDALVKCFREKTPGSARHYELGGDIRVDTRIARIRRPELEAAFYPIVGARAEGAQIWDIDGNRYLDVAMGIGTLLCGHSPEFIQHAQIAQVRRGIQNGPLAELADDIAAMVCALTGHERVLFGLSGSASVMNALRIARAATGRERIAMFRGAYHGQSDQTLAITDVSDPDGRAIPAGAGVSAAAVSETLILSYGKSSALDAVRAHGETLAGVIVEPVQSRNPALQPVEFLRALRALTAELGVPLIFDEIITGFRVHPQGAQGMFGVQPDLSIYGKLLGGGLPVSAVAGRAALMDRIDRQPELPAVPIGMTFDMQPVCLASAYAMLTHLAAEGPELQLRLNARTEQLCDRLNAVCRNSGAPISIARFGSMFRFAWQGSTSYAFTPLEMDIFYLGLLSRGLYLWEGRTCFLSTAHAPADEDEIVSVVTETLEDMARVGLFKTAPIQPMPTPQDSADSRRLDLTTGQRWLLLRQQEAGPDVPPWCVTERFTLEGRLDVNAFREAVADTVRHHDGLRSVVDLNAGCQRILSELEPDIQVLDFTSDGAAAVEVAARTASACVRDPFDLKRSSPLRIRAMQLSEQHWDILISCHHIVSDSISLGIVRDDIAARYSAHLRGGHDGKEGQGGEAAPGFETIIAQRAAARQLPEFDRVLQKLRQSFARVSPLPLPADGAVMAGLAGERITRNLDHISLVRVSRAARAYGMTPYMLMFSAFCLHLHAASGVSQLACGVPRAARETRESETVVGYCADLVPVISIFDPSESLAGYLKRTKDALVEALCLPVGCLETLLLEPLADGKRAGDLPFEAIFNLDPPVVPADFEGLRAETCAAPSAFALTPYRLDAVVVDGAMWLDADYRLDVFDDRSIGRWLSQFEAVLALLLETDPVTCRTGELIDRVACSGREEECLE